MSNSTYYLQPCPTCGRRLQIRVEYLGKSMVCQHCCGQFVATDPSTVRGDCPHYGNALLQRAEKLLASIAEQQSAVGHRLSGSVGARAANR